MLGKQRKKWMGFRLPEALVAEMESFLPRFRKSAGASCTVSDIVRVGLAFAMTNKAALLKGVA